MPGKSPLHDAGEIKFSLKQNKNVKDKIIRLTVTNSG